MKVRVWDKKKEQYTRNFALVTLANDLVAFPLEDSKEIARVQKIIRDNLSKLTPEDNLNIMPFYTSDYSLIDFANYYGIENYQIEYCSEVHSMEGRYFYENDVVEMSSVFDGFDNEPITVYGVVRFIRGSFCFWNNEGWCESVEIKPNSVKVIGTTHDVTLENYRGLE